MRHVSALLEGRVLDFGRELAASDPRLYLGLLLLQLILQPATYRHRSGQERSSQIATTASNKHWFFVVAHIISGSRARSSPCGRSDREQMVSVVVDGEWGGLQKCRIPVQVDTVWLT